MSAFTVSGVEFVAKGVGPYLSTLGRVDAAQQKLGGSVGSVTERFANAETAGSRFGKTLSNIGQIASGIIVAQVFNRITDAVGSAVSAGFEFNNAVEQAGAKINAFTKDGAKTAQILENVRKEAAATPFEFQAMADATAGLLPAAKQAQVGIMDLLRDAEVLAASNPAEGLEGAAFALREAVSGDFTSVIERFNLPRSMINQLKAEGLPALEIVRRAMGEMGYDMDLVSALANTASGRWSTFKDTLTNVAGTITQPIFDRFSQGLGTVNEWLAANEPMLTSMASLLANQVATAIETVTTKAAELFTAFQAGGVKGLAGALGIPPETYDTIANIATKVSEIITTIASYGGFGLTGILVVDPAAREATLTFLSDLWAWLSTNIPAAIQTASDLWNNHLMPGFTQIGETINAQLLPALNNLFDAFSSGTGGTQTLADLWQNTLKPALFAVGVFVRDTLFPAWVQLEQFLIGGLAVAINLLADYWRNVLFPAISAVADFVKNTVIPALSDLWAWLGPKIGDAVKKMSDLWTNTLQPALLSTNDAIGVVLDLLASLGRLFNAVVGKALEAFAGLWKNVLLPALVKVGNFLKDTLSPVFASMGQTVKEDVSPALKDLGEVVFPLLQEGLDYVKEAIKDVISYFDSLADKVSSFTLPDILQGNSPPPMANFMWDIAEATGDAGEAMDKFTQAGQSIMQRIASGAGLEGGSIKDAILSQLGFSAKMFASKDSLENEERAQAKQALFNAFEKTYGGIIAGTMGKEDFLSVFKEGLSGFDTEEFGEALGVAATKVDGFIATIRSQFGPLTLEMKAQAVSIAGQFASIAGNFANMVKEQVDGFRKMKEESGKYAVANEKLGVTIGEQETKLSELKAELLELTSAQELDTEAITEKQAAISKLSEEMDKNKQAVINNSLALADYHKELAKAINTGFNNPWATGEEVLASDLAMIELLQQFIDSGIESIRLWGDETEGMFAGTGLSGTWDQVWAHRELNELLAEQAQREADIAAQQKAQKDLSFLQSQLDLLRQGQALGVNVFEGLTFGLGAKASDLLAATNRIVTAMVDQINQDLQIGSPSRVMARIGRRVIEGMAKGLEGGRSMLDNVISSTPLLNGSLMRPLAQPAYAGGNTYNTTYEMPMTVHTTASAQATIRQYEVKRSMYAS